MRPTNAGRLEPLWALADDTRRALYDYVAGRRTPVGRDQAARAVGVPRSVAAYHLDRLAETGLLEVEFRRPAGRAGPGAGRPAKLYRRSDREVLASVPSRDYAFAADLLARAVGSARSRAAKRALEDEARAMGKSLGAGARGRAGMPGLRRLLADRGYEPFVDGDVTRLRNCPFRSLVEEHRDVVCAMNHALLDGVCETATSGAVDARLEPQEGACCVALIDASHPAPAP